MEIIDDDVTAKENRGRPSIYPWDEWLLPNKRVRLYYGDDFTVEPSSLRPQAHNQARARGGKAQTSLGTTASGKRYLDVTYKPGLTQEDADNAFNFEKTG